MKIAILLISLSLALAVPSDFFGDRGVVKDEVIRERDLSERLSKCKRNK